MIDLKEIINKILPDKLSYTLFIRYFGLTKIPLLFYIKPTVHTWNKESCVIKIPLNRRTKNHLDSMYFAVLAAGADMAAGLAAMAKIYENKADVSLSFKDFHADFFKRSEGDTLFTCNNISEINSFVDEVLKDNTRREMSIPITATCPSKFDKEPVAQFTLTLSLKNRTLCK